MSKLLAKREASENSEHISSGSGSVILKKTSKKVVYIYEKFSR